MHMFASFVMRATMSILKNWLFIDGIGLSWDIITIDDQSTFIKERNVGKEKNKIKTITNKRIKLLQM